MSFNSCGDVDTVLTDVEINTSSDSILAKRELSRVSKMYDGNGDGELDEAERAMRALDTTGRGYLTNDKIHTLMVEHIKVQRDLFKFKRVLIGLAVIVVILALSNLGTSFAAAYIAKDTTTNANNELINTKSNEAVSTQTTLDSFSFSRTYNDTQGSRRLCEKIDGVYTCETDSYLEMPKDEGERMINKCKQGKTVDLKRNWSDGSETVIQICPATKATFSDREARLDGVTMTISDDQQFYQLKGNKITQGVDDVCNDVSDCGSGLVCQDNFEAINACKRHCDRLRFGRQKLQGCYDACQFRSCQASSTQG